jgi:hypothetical protein
MGSVEWTRGAVMSPLEARLRQLEDDIKRDPPAFYSSAELPFALFRYDPLHPDEREWRIRREIQNLKVRIENGTGRTVHIVSLAEMLWRSIEESEGITTLTDMERREGFAAAQRQVGVYLTDPDWNPLARLIAEALSPLDARRDMVFLTRAAAFAPTIYALSILLEELMGRVRVPGVLFYPGQWNNGLSFMGLRGDDETVGSYRVKIYGKE